MIVILVILPFEFHINSAISKLVKAFIMFCGLLLILYVWQILNRLFIKFTDTSDIVLILWLYCNIFVTNNNKPIVEVAIPSIFFDCREILIQSPINISDLELNLTESVTSPNCQYQNWFSFQLKFTIFTSSSKIEMYLRET